MAKYCGQKFADPNRYQFCFKDGLSLQYSLELMATWTDIILKVLTIVAGQIHRVDLP